MIVTLDFEIPEGGEGVLYTFYAIVDAQGDPDELAHECNEDNNVSVVFDGICHAE